MKTFAAIVAISFIMVACSRGPNSNPGATGRPTLPNGWMNGSELDTSIAEPSPAATQAVRAAFFAHTSALEQVTARRAESETITADSEHPADWVPWHLDGMIASFGIDFGGVFGSLMADGSPSVKVTWQKQTSPRVAARSTRASAVRLRPGMSAVEVQALIDPAVRTAIESGHVRNEPALRRNLNAEGLKFLSLIRALSAVAPGQSWHVDGYQLSLSVTAAGDVTPVTNVGGTFMVIFDWQVTPGAPPVAAAPLNERERALQEQASSLAGTLMALLPDARAETAELRKAGFEFQVFQVGLGLTVGGDIGIATASASAGGRVIFKKAASSALATSFESSLPQESIPLIVPDAGQVPPSLAGAVSLPSGANAASSVVQVPSARIRNGLRRAIRMGAFFARQAVAEDSANWKTTEVEIGLDASVGGQLNLVTVAGSGLIRIGLERVE